MPVLISLVLLLLLLAGISLLVLELRHRLRPSSPLQLSTGPFQLKRRATSLEITGTVTIRNPHPRMEVFVPEIHVRPVLLGRADLTEVRSEVRIISLHPDEEARPDHYWAAYIVKGRKSTGAELQIRLSGPAGVDLEAILDTVWIDLQWVNYGPFGRLTRRDGILVPIQRPDPAAALNTPWREGEGCRVLPVRTHLLGVLDDPLDVLRHYCGDLLQRGDVLTIGETPLAVIQGRYHHPSTVEPSLLARQLCRVFHPTSSLASACGLQTLIDVVGPARVLSAWVAGSAMKLVGIPGGFYRLAGEQARLIDDITGTTPPYDQTLVLGPSEPEAFCREAAAALGVAVAVVDVNDLGRVKVLAASRDCDIELLQRALRPNPAGNANERTPVVLVRPH